MLTIKCFQFSPIQENTYLLYNEFNNCIIIDPGCYFEEEREILAQFILSNQIKTREKPSPKTPDTAEAGALECYIRAASMLELMSAAELNNRKPKFNSLAWRGPRQESRTDRQLPVTTKAS